MLTSDLNLSKNCKRIEILKCVLKNVHYYYYYYLRCCDWKLNQTKLQIKKIVGQIGHFISSHKWICFYFFCYLVQSGQVGFYRVQNSSDMLKLLLSAMKDNSLPPWDRLGLENDLFALVCTCALQDSYGMRTGKGEVCSRIRRMFTSAIKNCTE